MIARRIEYEETEYEMTQHETINDKQHDVSVTSVTSNMMTHDERHGYMMTDVRTGSPRLGGSSSVERQTGERHENYTNTQLRNTRELETDGHCLDRSSEGEFSGICPPRGCGGVGCEGDDSVIEDADSRCHDTTDATDAANIHSADPPKPTGKHPSYDMVRNPGTEQ